MKPVYYFLLPLVFILGCEKESNNESYANEIYGKWIWVETCGGFSGACNYPSKNRQELLVVTYNNKWIRTIITNEYTTSYTMTFTIGDSYEKNDIIFYNILFSKNSNAVVWFLDYSTLGVASGDVYEKFRRLY